MIVYLYTPCISHQYHRVSVCTVPISTCIIITHVTACIALHTCDHHDCNRDYIIVVYIIPYSRKTWRGIKFGGLAVQLAIAKLKSANISYLHILYVWQSLTEPPNLNLPIFLQWRFRAQPPNLIPANISGYTVSDFVKLIARYMQESKLSVNDTFHDSAVPHGVFFVHWSH